MTTPTTTPQREAAATRAAAGERGKRALWQGLGLDVITAVAVALLMWLPDADLSSRAAWVLLGYGLLRTVLTAAASYVMRLKVQPAKEAELVDGAYVITDLDSGRRRMTDEAPPLD